MAKKNKKHPWYRQRGYPHFDLPLGFREAKQIVKNPSLVAAHSFYPFIEFTLETFKVRRDEATEKLKRIPKYRPIAYASHVDCYIYSYYSYLLSKCYEREIESKDLHQSVLAFRALGKNNIDFAFEAFELIRKFGECSVLALDVRAFFDNLDHLVLKKAWMALLGCSQLPNDHYSVFKAITKYSTVDLEKLYELLGISLNNRATAPVRLCSAEEFRSSVRASGLIQRRNTVKGIPQGSPISALLSNIYLLEFDTVMHDFVKECNGHYLRYCDDILIIVPQSHKTTAENLALSAISKLELEINGDKTDRVDFFVSGKKLVASKSLQYLGFLFDGERALLRSASLARYSERMRRGVRLAKATMAKRNIAKSARGEAERPLFRRKLYRKYSHLGRRNFITYGYDAARKMGSSSIRRQLHALWQRLQAEIDLA